jgi:hypothetical protein
MTNFVEEYEAPEYWHRDSVTVLKWIKTKAHEHFKAKLQNEEDVMVAVIQMLAKPEYGNLEKLNLPDEIELKHAMVQSLELNRQDACRLINELIDDHGISIREAVREVLE